MKTRFEKDDVSVFRTFVREKRFNKPTYEGHLSSLLERLEKRDAPPIELVIARSDNKDHMGTLDIVGIGKTDFSYFAGSFIRAKDSKIDVLAFPDIVGQIENGLSFYNSIFVPEIMRVTRNNFDKTFDFFKSIGIVINSVISRSILFLRVNILLTVGLLAFVIGAISLDDLFEHQSEIALLLAKIATPLVLTLVFAGWLLVVWDKIKKDKGYLLEWKENSIKNLRKAANIEVANVLPSQLVNRFAHRKAVIILDDASHIDAQSLSYLIELVSPQTEESSQRKNNHCIGLILISDNVMDEKKSSIAQKGVYDLLNEFRCRRNNWLCFDLTPPDINDVESFLWGAYENGAPWRLVERLIDHFPALKNNTGFLLQFLYEETKILENQKGDFRKVEFEKLLDEYKSFLAESEYKILADKVLAQIPAELLAPCKEFLKYTLSFESPVRNSEIIHMLMNDDGEANPKKIGDCLIENGIIKMDDGNYRFVKPSDKYTLALNWSEWTDNSPNYYTKTFRKIHDQSSNTKLKDNPHMAKWCEPSYLVIDTLWREGDALWFYGGNADILTALEFYGIDDNGALAKWYQLFKTDLDDDNITNGNYTWHVEAKNSPYRYKTNRSVRSESFIGDLVQIVAALYFSSGDYKKAIYVLDDLWDEILRSCLNSSEVTDKIKNKVKSADAKIQLQISEYFLQGSVQERDWEQAFDRLNKIESNQTDMDFQFDRQALLWKIEHLKRFGIGNLPSTLLLVRDMEFRKLQEFASPNVTFAYLPLLQSYLYHYRDIIRTRTSNPSKKAEMELVLSDAKLTLSNLQKTLATLRKRVERSLQLPYPVMEYSAYPVADAEEQILTYKGLWFYFSGLILYYEYLSLLDEVKSSSDILEIGKSIRRYFDISEKMWGEYYPTLGGLTGYEELVQARKAVADGYSKFMVSDNPKRHELQSIQNQMKENSKALLRQIEKGYYDESLKSLKLASDLASIRLQKYDETAVNYYRGVVLITAMTASSDAEKQKVFESLIDSISEIEIDSKTYITGHANDSLRYHIRVAEYIGEKRFEEVYQHYDKARMICDRIGKFIPGIVKGEIVARQLNLVGNVHTFMTPNDIFTLANEALEIFNSYSGSGVTPEDLESHKAHVRWWIAEACARMAIKDSDSYEKYFKIAQQHWNWAQRQANDNEMLQKHYLPKFKQVQSQFQVKSGEYKKAVELLRNALIEFDDNLFEQIQTLAQIIEYDLMYLRGNTNKKEIESFLGNMLSFRGRLLNARVLLETGQQKNDMLFYETATGAVTFAHTVLLSTGLGQESEMAKTALELWTFGINGFLEWKMYGRAAIELGRLKEACSKNTLIHLPIEFNDMVKRCVSKWDPRRELTDKAEVEKALGFLVETKISIGEDKEKSKDKNGILEKVHLLLARPTPDTKDAYQILKNALEIIDVSNPSLEDIELIRLLIICCRREEDMEKVKEYNLLFTSLSNSLASKVYLEIANAFSDTPEIRDRYLYMAATVSSNKYSEEANREIARALNVEGVRKPDLIKDELEKTNYLRLMNLSVEEYDIAEAYSLLYLFENELRRLIAYQFNQRSGWWKKGVPSDIFDKVAKENNERIKGDELLNRITLGELFKIIRYGDNWGQIFESVFYSSELLKAREHVITQVRNRIAHTDRDLSIDSIKEYVIAVKNMIKQMQSFLPE